MRTWIGLLAGGACLPFAAAVRADEVPAQPLPVRAVTLFSSGVGFTLREGEVDGDATVPLTFRTQQINDILKSLVLLDERGRVRPAIYGAKDPVVRTLQSFAVDVTQPLSRSELLNRLRGSRVEVRVERPGGPETVSGQIVGVESRTVPQQPPLAQAVVETLTVLADAGLQYVPLDQVRSLKLLDPRLDGEFRTALGLLAAASDDRRRQVELHFEGKGKRRVRVGYVSEAPLWKVSYRLLLGGAKLGTDVPGGTADKPFLQGWALIENTSDEDWKDVSLSLVSGRPVSFVQDLYQPLYLPRPVVAPDILASPTPQLSEGAVEAADKRSELARSAGRPAGPGGMGGFGGRGMGGGFGGGGARDMAAEMPAPVVAGKSVAFDMASAAESVSAQASGESAGELFRYTVDVPVTLPRQRAAMIPILAGGVSGDKVSVYNPDTIHPTIPMNAVRLRNDTGLHLKAGPVTLFDDGVYAGDARMPDIPPADNRLITYALDLTIAGERQDKGAGRFETGILIRRGVLEIQRKEVREFAYTLRNKGNKARTVLVEHPFEAEWKLIAPAKFEERTPSLYRFPVSVPASASATLAVKVERPVSETLGLVDADVNFLQVQYERKEGVPAKLKEALGNILQRRRRIQELQGMASNADQQVGAIMQDQERIRQNMQALDRTSDLYKRYVEQLGEQETRIQTLRGESAKHRTAASEADRDLRAYIDTLTIGG